MNESLISQLQEKLRDLEAQLQEKNVVSDSVVDTADEDEDEESNSESSGSSVLVANGTLVRHPRGKDEVQKLQLEVKRLQEGSRREEEARRQAESQNQRLSSELDTASSTIRQSFDEANQLKRQLSAHQERQKELNEEAERRVKEEFGRKEHEMSRQLEEERLRCKASMAESDALRRQLGGRSVSRQRNQSNQPDVERIAGRLQEVEGQLVTLKEKYASCNQERTRISSDLRDSQSQLSAAVGRSRRTMFCVLMPLLVLFLAILIAFHPST